MILLGFFPIIAGILLLLGKSQIEVVYLGRYSEFRFFTAIFSIFDGIVFLIFRYIFFGKSLPQQGIIVISSLFLVFAFVKTMFNYVDNERFLVDKTEPHFEYRYIAYWSFYDPKTEKLDSDFSLMDIGKNFINPMGTEAAYRLRWIGLIVNSVQPKFNTWAFCKLGVSNIDAFSFLCGILIASCIFYFVWIVTFDWLLSIFAFVLYFTSFDFMATSLYLFRIGRPLVSIPFLFLVIMLGLVRSPPLFKPIDNIKSAVIFVLVLGLLGLDEYGWSMILVLLGLYWYQLRFVPEEQRDILKSNTLLLVKITALSMIISFLIFVIFKPSFITNDLLFSSDHRLHFMDRILNVITLLGHVIGYFSDIFFHNIGFYRSQEYPLKALMQFIYFVIFFLVWFSFRDRIKNKLLFQFCSIHILSSVSIILVSFIGLGDITNNPGYYASPIAIGYPIYLCLIAYSLKAQKNKKLYALTVFVMGVSAVVNSFGFKRVDSSFWPNMRFESQSVSELRKARSSIERGEIPVFEHDPARIRQKPWVKRDFSKRFYGKEIRTLPLLYYYLLPFIQQGKILIREEYSEVIQIRERIDLNTK